MSRTRLSRCLVPALVVLALAAASPRPVFAQAAPAAAPADDPDGFTFTGGTDFVNAYMFRGIRQDDTKVMIWPYADLGFALFSGEGLVKSVGLNVGVWNSLHTGKAGTQGPSGKLWYEGDFYSTLSFGLPAGLNFGTTYTAYTSPNGSFSTVKELAFKLADDDSGLLGRAAVHPYAMLAYELDIQTLNAGQADGGSKAGLYVEVGATPSWGNDAVTIGVPLKVGLSASDYYEQKVVTAAGTSYVDNRFGYFSVAGLVTKPLGGTTKFGNWNVHGGVEFQKLGTTTTELNLGKDHKTIVSFGLGLTN